MFVVRSLFALQKLTEEQAARLKKAQEERNREDDGEEGKADEEVTDGEEDDEQPVNGKGKDTPSDYIVSGNLKRVRGQNNNVIMVMDIFRNI